MCLRRTHFHCSSGQSFIVRFSLIVIFWHPFGVFGLRTLIKCPSALTSEACFLSILVNSRRLSVRSFCSLYPNPSQCLHLFVDTPATSKHWPNLRIGHELRCCMCFWTRWLAPSPLCSTISHFGCFQSYFPPHIEHNQVVCFFTLRLTKCSFPKGNCCNAGASLTLSFSLSTCAVLSRKKSAPLTMVSRKLLIFFAWSCVTCSKASHIIPEVCLYSSQSPPFYGAKNFIHHFQCSMCHVSISFAPSIVWQSIPVATGFVFSACSRKLLSFFSCRNSQCSYGSFPTILKIFHGALGCFQGIVFGTSWSQLQTPTFRCNELSQRNIIFCGTVTALGTNILSSTSSCAALFRFYGLWHFRFLFWFPPRAFFPVLLASSQSGQSDSFLGSAQAISSSCFNFLAPCNLVPSSVSFWHLDNSFSLMHQIQGFFCFPSLLQWCSCILSFALLCIMSLPSVTSLNVSCLLWIQLLHFLNWVLTPSFQLHQPFPLRSQFAQLIFLRTHFISHLLSHLLHLSTFSKVFSVVLAVLWCPQVNQAQNVVLQAHFAPVLHFMKKTNFDATTAFSRAFQFWFSTSSCSCSLSSDQHEFCSGVGGSILVEGGSVFTGEQQEENMAKFSHHKRWRNWHINHIGTMRTRTSDSGHNRTSSCQFHCMQQFSSFGPILCFEDHGVFTIVLQKFDINFVASPRI